MKRVVLTIGFSLLVIMFSSCMSQKAINTSTLSSVHFSNSSTIEYEYFYRGFASVKEDKVKTYPQGTLIIETDEDWHDFMDKYVPGIPYDISVDFSKESLVFNGLFSAKPTYAQWINIKEFIIKGNRLEAEYDKSNGIYAQNIEDITHCFVNIVKVNKKDLPSSIENIWHADNTIVKPSIQNNDQSTMEAKGPEIVNNLKSIKIENLNDEKNSKVTINLPEDWYAKELIFDKAPNFEYNAEKNKQIKKVYSFEFYNSIKMDKFNQYGIKRLAGEFYAQGYYRDQSESSRFPNHSEVKSRVYSGETVLGKGEIFILDCDLPRELRTEKYSTYDMVYAWIPIKDEALAYNLSISVPLGEKDDDYIKMVKEMLNADNQTYINPDDIEWVTIQGGLHITTKVLFPGHDDDKINRIADMINSGTGKIESTETEINVIHSRARPIGIYFHLKNGNKVYIWTDYTTKTFKNGWSATPVDDKFVLNIENNGKDEYYTVLSKDMAKYLGEGWKVDMPMVNEVTVTSESAKEGDKVVIRDGDKAVVSGDGCTVKEVFIYIRRNTNPKEDYIVGRAVPEFGKWEWDGIITCQFKTLDGKKVTLAKDLYDIIADNGKGQIGICGVIDFRD